MFASENPSSMHQSWRSTRLSISRQHFKQQGLSSHSRCRTRSPCYDPGFNYKGTFSRFPRSSAKQPPTPPRVASGRLPAILSPSRPPHLRCPGSPPHPASRPHPGSQPGADTRAAQAALHRCRAKVIERPGNTRAGPAPLRRTDTVTPSVLRIAPELCRGPLKSLLCSPL